MNHVCTTAETSIPLAADDGADVTATNRYHLSVIKLVSEEQFDTLDCLANAERSGKTRFAGGMWKLHNLYGSLDQPVGGLQHATEEDYESYLRLLKRWLDHNPDSITAHIALASVYMNYAWQARGDGMADTVSSSGWQLFKKRVSKAKDILDKANTLPVKDPEWFLIMQAVAQAQGWNRQQTDDLLNRAMQFERSYYYVYRVQADILLPKWIGQEGDTERFAETIADRLGGKLGDEVYAQIATNIVCNCPEDEIIRRMSWSRIQAGFAALEADYGMSLTNLNNLAKLAAVERDPQVAATALSRIGDQWSESTWTNKEAFDQANQWAKQMAPFSAHRQQMRDEAIANLKTPEGARYSKLLQQSLQPAIADCAKQPDAVQTSFELLIRVGEDGKFAGAGTEPSTTVAFCLIRSVAEKKLPPPKVPNMWLRYEVDPQVSSNDAAGK